MNMYQTVRLKRNQVRMFSLFPFSCVSHMLTGLLTGLYFFIRIILLVFQIYYYGRLRRQNSGLSGLVLPPRLLNSLAHPHTVHECQVATCISTFWLEYSVCVLILLTVCFLQERNHHFNVIQWHLVVIIKVWQRFSTTQPIMTFCSKFSFTICVRRLESGVDKCESFDHSPHSHFIPE